MTRAERRRYDRDAARSEQYRESGHRALVLYVGARPSRSKYMPHIGAKQRAKALALYPQQAE